MKTASLILAAGCLLAQAPKVTVHTQVREDIFAGFLVNDLARFETGVARLDRMLAEDRNNAAALAWRGGAELYLAVRSHEAGRHEEFAERHVRAMEWMEQALRLGPQNVGVLATAGASIILFADRLPADRRAAALKQGRAAFLELEKLQKPFLDRMPLHMRGELLAGLAQAAERLGYAAEAKAYLTRIVETMPGTPYESRARKWLDQPALARKGNLVCQTCHEPGRLENVLKAGGTR